MSVVVSFRIPRKLKEELERLGIDYISEIKAFLEKLIRMKKTERLRMEMDRLRGSLKKIDGNLSARFIREDRDER